MGGHDRAYGPQPAAEIVRIEPFTPAECTDGAFERLVRRSTAARGGLNSPSHIHRAAIQVLTFPGGPCQGVIPAQTKCRRSDVSDL